MRTRPLIEVAPHRQLVTLPPECTVRQACERMREARVSAMVVADRNGRLLGIFTGRDAVARVLAEGRDANATQITEVMTREVATLGPRDIAIEALRLMHDGGFRHVPVVEGGKVLAIVSRSDFRALERARLEEETELFEGLR